jgi:hypothetical protein
LKLADLPTRPVSITRPEYTGQHCIIYGKWSEGIRIMGPFETTDECWEVMKRLGIAGEIMELRMPRTRTHNETYNPDLGE